VAVIARDVFSVGTQLPRLPVGASAAALVARIRGQVNRESTRKQLVRAGVVARRAARSVVQQRRLRVAVVVDIIGHGEPLRDVVSSERVAPSVRASVSR
jgi:hypothetical protein